MKLLRQSQSHSQSKSTPYRLTVDLERQWRFPLSLSLPSPLSLERFELRSVNGDSWLVTRPNHTVLWRSMNYDLWSILASSPPHSIADDTILIGIKDYLYSVIYSNVVDCSAHISDLLWYSILFLALPTYGMKWNEMRWDVVVWVVDMKWSDIENNTKSHPNRETAVQVAFSTAVARHHRLFLT